MISTGIEALDHRLGSLRPGSLYAFFGSATSGKSVLGLHFLVEGLARRERCVLVTSDEPAILESRAAYVGVSPGTFTQNPLLRVVRGSDLAPVGAQSLRARLEQRLGLRSPESRPARIVFDSMDALADYVRTPHALVSELRQLLAQTTAVAYVMLRMPPGNDDDPGVYEPFISNAEGAFRLRVKPGGERCFQFLKAPQGAAHTGEFQFNLRIGAGFIEELVLDAPEVTPLERRTVVVLDEIGEMPQEVLASLRVSYEVELLRSPAGTLSRLSAGRYGTLVVTVDPFDDSRAFDLVVALRKEGNAAPIVCAAPSRGLRGTTRSRGLRAGADDFFVTDLAPSEVLERIQIACQRGTHRRSGFNQVGQFMQPVGPDGSARPMTRPEFLQAVSMLLEEQPPLFFCYLEFSVPAGSTARIWSPLRSRLRVGDGDLIGRLTDRQFGCVLDRITGDQTLRVMQRIRSAHPDLEAAEAVLVLASPGAADAIGRRLGIAPARTGSMALAVQPDS